MSIYTNRKVLGPNCSSCGRRKVTMKKAAAQGTAALVCKTCDYPDPELVVGSTKFARGLDWPR